MDDESRAGSVRGVATRQPPRRIEEIDEGLANARAALAASRALHTLPPVTPGDLEYRLAERSGYTSGGQYYHALLAEPQQGGGIVAGLGGSTRWALRSTAESRHFDPDATIEAIRAARSSIRADFENARRGRAK